MQRTFGYFSSKKLFLTKEQFTFNSVISDLDLNKSILDQKEVILSYKNEGVVKSVSAKHGIIFIFKINNQYFLLGSALNNPVEDMPIELQASIGGTRVAKTDCSIIESLESEIAIETQNMLFLNEFYISSHYVCHREPNWGEWSVCFIKIAALYKNITTLTELKEKLVMINRASNKSYGIYNLNNVIEAARNTAGFPEGSQKTKSELTNYFTGKTESFVIFDDNAIAKLFENLTIDDLFIDLTHKRCRYD